MPLHLASGHPTLLIRRDAFERAQFSRASFDKLLGLGPGEFQVEGDLIAIGPIYDEAALDRIIPALEEAGLTHFDDFFDMSGNWPEWLSLYAMSKRKSQPNDSV